jgi:glycosyltransferase involved in cell wall biosynthesis
MNMPEHSLKIVFVTNNYTPYSGGVVSSIFAYTQELKKQGHEVFIITLDFLGAQHNDPDYVFRIACPIKFQYKSNPMAIPWLMQRQMDELIEKIKPDIVHAHHPWLLGRAALKSARKVAVPVVFTYHTLYEHYAHYVPFPVFFTKPIINHLVHHYCREVDGIIAPSGAVYERLQSFDCSVPIIVLPSPIAEDFLQQKQIDSHINDEEKVRFKLLLVSRLVKEKNIELLLDMMSDLEHEQPGRFSLTLIGYGSHQKLLKRYAYEQLRLTHDAVVFLDKKSKHELITLYPCYDLFVFSSLSDTQGLVLAEAMSSGLPVVALDGPGQRDIIHQGQNGFLVSSRQEIKQVLHVVSNDRHMYSRMQHAARETALRYCPFFLTQALVKFYRQFV